MKYEDIIWSWILANLLSLVAEFSMEEKKLNKSKIVQEGASLFFCLGD